MNENLSKAQGNNAINDPYVFINAIEVLLWILHLFFTCNKVWRARLCSILKRTLNRNRGSCIISIASGSTPNAVERAHSWLIRSFDQDPFASQHG